MPRFLVWLVLLSSLTAAFAGAPSAWRAVDGRWEGPWRGAESHAVREAIPADAPRVAATIEAPALVAALDPRALASEPRRTSPIVHASDVSEITDEELVAALAR